MEILLIIVLLVMIGGFGFLIYTSNKRFCNLEASAGKDNLQNLLNMVLELMKMTQQELGATRQEIHGSLDRNKDSMDKQIGDTNRTIGDRLDNAARVIGEVKQELGKVKEIGRNMKELQDFLRSPKLRGNIGEQVLKDLLSQFFPVEYFEMQYGFRDGQTVDAAIKTDKGIIPIDSKFPMDNFLKISSAPTQEEQDACYHEFEKDVKKHIQDIAKKYILPQEGTVDFAVMYIPSEAIYYEIIRGSPELQNLSYEKRVFPVSPNTFYAFLKVILIGLEGKKIEASAKRILETLDGIRVENDKFNDVLGILTTHISNAKNCCDKVNNEYSKLSSQIDNAKLLK